MLSWNVNGLRSIHRKGHFDWFERQDAEIIALQETKAKHFQLPEEMIAPFGYSSYWNSPEKKGYAGVGVYTRKKPSKVEKDFPSGKLDTEGRFLGLEFEKFAFMNIYFPNGGGSRERLDYKLAFYDRFLEYLRTLKGKNLVICGDFNTAHRPMDLARPGQNKFKSGFLPEEREWLDRFIDAGFVDTFRRKYPKKIKYSWWDYKTRSRERNVGWRIDYFFVTKNIYDSLNDAFILNDVPGSDHCPVGISIEFL